MIPYSSLPQLYLCGNLFVSFIFEQPFDLRLLLDFFWVWFYLRFFMKTHYNNELQVGDLSNGFAICTFFPQRFQKPIMIASELSYAFLNMCGLMNILRNWLAKSQVLMTETKSEETAKPS